MAGFADVVAPIAEKMTLPRGDFVVCPPGSDDVRLCKFGSCWIGGSPNKVVTTVFKSDDHDELAAAYALSTAYVLLRGRFVGAQGPVVHAGQSSFTIENSGIRQLASVMGCDTKMWRPKGLCENETMHKLAWYVGDTSSSDMHHLRTRASVHVWLPEFVVDITGKGYELTVAVVVVEPCALGVDCPFFRNHSTRETMIGCVKF